MNILFYRYGSICEPDMIEAFEKFGITVVEEKGMITDKGKKPSDIVQDVADKLRKRSFMFVFSINFFPPVSEICQIAGVPYVCWTVDCPVLELFSPSLSNPCNRVFLFDRNQYLYFKDRNPGKIFYLPLGSNPDRWDRVLAGASSTEADRFAGDVSFVGSLYSEKNPYRSIDKISEYAKGYIRGIVEAQLQIYGYNFISEMLDEKIVEEMKSIIPDMQQPLVKDDKEAEKYLMANCFIGTEVAQEERERTFAVLGKNCAVDLYTRSYTTDLEKKCKEAGTPVYRADKATKGLNGVHIHDGVRTLDEMPLVFNKSKINLNITMRPISSGLSLRVFDICACGGMLLTNYQEELPEMYEPGVEVEMYSSPEELHDKVMYYLEHDSERQRIARRGYEKTVSAHRWDLRIREMIAMISKTL
ncbi:MAG: DUF3880 domain-containing protein [Lachnospiraceae bacterium]|nr:DUF3880 domain-containing protein [Lachnospiraceae bacterium]